MVRSLSQSAEMLLGAKRARQRVKPKVKSVNLIWNKQITTNCHDEIRIWLLPNKLCLTTVIAQRSTIREFDRSTLDDDLHVFYCKMHFAYTRLVYWLQYI